MKFKKEDFSFAQKKTSGAVWTLWFIKTIGLNSAISIGNGYCLC